MSKLQELMKSKGLVTDNKTIYQKLQNAIKKASKLKNVFMMILTQKSYFFSIIFNFYI